MSLLAPLFVTISSGSNDVSLFQGEGFYVRNAAQFALSGPNLVMGKVGISGGMIVRILLEVYMGDSRSEGNKGLEHFDKYCRVYTRLMDVALFQTLYEMENDPEDKPVLGLNERLEIVKKITRNKFLKVNSLKMSEDQMYKNLRTEYDKESFDKVAVKYLREEEKH